MQAGNGQTTEVLQNGGARRLRLIPQLLLLLLVASIARAAGPTVPIITTYAGFGPSTTGEDPLGDGGPATQAYLYLPGDLDVDRSGNLYLVSMGRVRKVTPAGIISTVFALDGAHPDETGFYISGIAVDGVGNVFVSDRQGNRVRKVTPGGAINIIAGSGQFGGFSGDGGRATEATLFSPGALTIDRSGNLLISDSNNHRIRKVDTSGTITTLVGNGDPDSSGDGGPARSAGLSSVGASVMDAAGNLYLIDGNLIRKVNTAGTISLFAGGGPFQYDPVATRIQLAIPVGLALDGSGNLYVAESHQLVRMISPQGIVRLVAGAYDARSGYNGDGGPADQALLKFPAGIAVDAQGNQFVSDSLNFRVRKITPQPAVSVPNGPDAFRAYKVSPLAGWPADIVVGDVNGDRRSDVITSTSSDPSQADPANDFKLRVQLKLADGTLAPPLVFAYPAGTANTGGHLALADFNSDGILDVAVGHATGVSVMAGSKTSSFVLNPFYTGTATPADEAMTVGDMDRDGIADVVSVHTDRVDSTLDPRLTIAYGNGSGTTSRQTSVPVAYASARSIAVTEINGDGWPDVVDANFWNVDTALNDAHGGLLPMQLAAQESTYGLSVGDINGDNRPDVLASVLYGDDLMVLPQSETGLMPSPQHLRSYSLGGDTAVADMDGDRRADVVVAHGSGAVSLILQTPTGLQQAVKYSLPINDVSASDGPMAIGDVSGDGCLDIVVLVRGVGLVTLEGQHCRIAVNGNNPRIPQRPTPVSADVQQESMRVDTTSPASHVTGDVVRSVRNILVRLNPLPRALAWLAGRIAAMSHEAAPLMPPAAAPRDRVAMTARTPFSQSTTITAHSGFILRGAVGSGGRGRICSR